jgi:hypothetical protein
MIECSDAVNEKTQITEMKQLAHGALFIDANELP